MDHEKEIQKLLGCLKTEDDLNNLISILVCKFKHDKDNIDHSWRMECSLCGECTHCPCNGGHEKRCEDICLDCDGTGGAKDSPCLPDGRPIAACETCGGTGIHD